MSVFLTARALQLKRTQPGASAVYPSDWRRFSSENPTHRLIPRASSLFTTESASRLSVRGNPFKILGTILASPRTFLVPRRSCIVQAQQAIGLKHFHCLSALAF